MARSSESTSTTTPTPPSPHTRFQSALSPSEIKFLNAEFADLSAHDHKISEDAALSDDQTSRSGRDTASLSDDKSSLSDGEFADLMREVRDFTWDSVPGEIDRLKKLDINWEHLLGIWPNDTAAQDERNALHFIIVAEQEGHKITETLRLRAMKALVKAVPSDMRTKMINTPDLAGITALHLAAANQTPSFVEFLIKHGASVNTKADDNTTPLHHAAGALNKATVEALLKHLPEKAERLCYDERLRTPIDQARSKEKKESDGIIALIQGDHENEPVSRSVPVSDMYVLQKDVDLEPDEDARVRTLKYTFIGNKPVTEILDEPFSWLEEFRRRHHQIENTKSATPTTISSEAKHWLSCWLHLPEHNVSGHNLNLSDLVFLVTKD